MDESETEKLLTAQGEEHTMPKEQLAKTDIIVFPDFEKLKNEVEKIRTELSMLLLERDELQFVICRNIETAYMLKLGGLEYKAYEAQCTALRLKRKIELIQAKKNRQEKVVLSAIEETLKTEFAEYQKRLNEQIEKMNKALERSKCKVLTDEENRELKKIYRKIVKELHPDLNPDISAEKVQLFNNAVKAYKNGDLNELKIINEMVGDGMQPEQSKDAMTQLIEEKEHLLSLLKPIKDSIEDIKSKYPYNLKAIVESEKKTEQMRHELEQVIEQYNELIEIYKQTIDEMLR